MLIQLKPDIQVYIRSTSVDDATVAVDHLAARLSGGRRGLAESQSASIESNQDTGYVAEFQVTSLPS